MSICPNTIRNLNNENIDRLIRNILPYFFSLVFITTAVGSFDEYLAHAGWTIGDWLINYQGGMVRRGLTGEFIYKLSQFSHVTPGFFVFLFQTLFYFVFFVFSYLTIKRQPSLLPYAFLMFSPFIFTFQINDSEGGYRKEIIHFAALAFLVYSANVFNSKTFEKVFYSLLLLYPIFILTHEMLAIFLPYFFVVFISVTKLTRRNVIIISLLLLPSVISFFISIYYSGSSTQMAAIFDSLARENYPLTGGAIEWIGKSTSSAMDAVNNAIYNKNYLFYYIQILLLSIIAYIPIRSHFIFIFKQNLSVALVLMSILGSAILFVLAVDWGRFIYINLISLFLLTLLPTSRSLKSNKYIPNKISYKAKKKSTYMIASVFMLYSLFWHVPHCCSPNPYAQSYRDINAIAFIKPYFRIIKRFVN